MIKRTSDWNRLKKDAKRIKRMSLRDEFLNNPGRSREYSLSVGGIYLDYSKNLIDKIVLRDMNKLLDVRNFQRWREAMFSGEKINHTENRAVAHVALRSLSRSRFMVDGQNVMPEVRKQLEKMHYFVEKVRRRRWLGHTEKPIEYIVNIGIGGSDLGPKMATETLKNFSTDGLFMHYVSNVDANQIHEVLQHCDPERTMFIVCSKSFTTQETLSNANIARDWFIRNGGTQESVNKHFVAVTSNVQEAVKFGIPETQQFEMWDWVGGRFSLWSTIGLSTALMIGMKNFMKLLKGAEEMDKHFLTAPLEENMPVIMASLGVWYSNFLDASSHAIIPYDHCLRSLPEYMQQLDMESNGKRIGRDGKYCDYSTAPVVWGTPGANGQHAYFQLLHQGGRLIPTDFILVKDNPSPIGVDNTLLLANAIAQMEALMKGKTEREARNEMEAAGLSDDQVEKLLPYKVFPGNLPSNAIVLDKMTPENLGSLIALYEHKAFVQGILWDLNSFDQWGVEYGKQLASRILDEIEKGQEEEHDASTSDLIDMLLH